MIEQKKMSFFKNEKGSGGVGVIIIGSLVTWFLLLPLGCFFIERHMYTVEVIRSLQVVTEVIESIQLEVKTDPLSRGQVDMKSERLEHLLRKDIECQLEKIHGVHRIKQMTFKWNNLANEKDKVIHSSASAYGCEVDLIIGVEPTTVIGGWMTEADGLLSINIQSTVEFPLNQ